MKQSTTTNIIKAKNYVEDLAIRNVEGKHDDVDIKKPVDKVRITPSKSGVFNWIEHVK